MNVLSSRFAAICIGAVLAGAAFVGCGGSDGDSGDALSKEEYIAQADAICAETSVKSDAAVNEFATAYQSGDFNSAADIIQETGVTTDAALADLKELVPPEEDQETIDSLFEVSDEQSALVADFVEAVRSGDDAAVQAVGVQADELDTQSNQIADDYGFVDCGSAGESS